MTNVIVFLTGATRDDLLASFMHLVIVHVTYSIRCQASQFLADQALFETSNFFLLLRE